MRQDHSTLSYGGTLKLSHFGGFRARVGGNWEDARASFSQTSHVASILEVGSLDVQTEGKTSLEGSKMTVKNNASVKAASLNLSASKNVFDAIVSSESSQAFIGVGTTVSSLDVGAAYAKTRQKQSDVSHHYASLNVKTSRSRPRETFS